MNDELSSTFSRLRESTDQLNSITDRASELVSKTEEFLNRVCSVGVSAHVYYGHKPIVGEDGSEYGSTYSALAYKRIGKRYRINVETGTDLDPTDSSAVPWAECTREAKLESIRYLVPLVNKIAESVEARVAKARESVDLASEVLEVLEANSHLLED